MSEKKTAWPGAVLLSLGNAAYLGRVHDTAVHRHHTLQICVAGDEPFRLRAGPDEPWHEYRTAMVAPDVPHQIDGGGGIHLLVYLEAETREGHSLIATGGGRIDALDEALRGVKRGFLASSAVRPPSAAQMRRIVSTVLAPLTLGSLGARELEPRIARVVAELRNDPDRYSSLDQVAAAVSLSPGRLRHLFVEQVGIPFRRFRLWTRLEAAMRGLANGATLTEAAHAAGFADSAHLSRVFRENFGLAPSAVAGGVVLLTEAGQR